jgi:hypothetical protein
MSTIPKLNGVSNDSCELDGQVVQDNTRSRFSLPRVSLGIEQSLLRRMELPGVCPAGRQEGV